VERSQFIISKSHQPNVTFQSFTFEVLIRLRQINEKNDDDFVSLNRQKKPMHSNIPLYMKNGMIALALQWERCTSKIWKEWWPSSWGYLFSHSANSIEERQFKYECDAVLTKRFGKASKKQPFENSFQLILKQNVKKVWERRSHAFSHYYTSLKTMITYETTTTIGHKLYSYTRCALHKAKKQTEDLSGYWHNWL